MLFYLIFLFDVCHCVSIDLFCEAVCFNLRFGRRDQPLKLVVQQRVVMSQQLCALVLHFVPHLDLLKVLAVQNAIAHVLQCLYNITNRIE